jgi:hypothetical protein
MSQQVFADLLTAQQTFQELSEKFLRAFTNQESLKKIHDACGIEGNYSSLLVMVNPQSSEELCMVQRLLMNENGSTAQKHWKYLNENPFEVESFLGSLSYKDGKLEMLVYTNISSKWYSFKQSNNSAGPWGLTEVTDIETLNFFTFFEKRSVAEVA